MYMSNIEYKEEIRKDNHPYCISKECIQKIIEQMKLKVCKILLKKGHGLVFLQIKFPK